MTRGATALLLLAVLGAEGCGYRLAGGNTFLPERIRVIAVAPFQNRTSRPEIEQRVTEEVSRELAKRGRYRVVTEAAGADAILEGVVAELRTNPVAFSSDGTATRLEVVVSLEASLRELASDEVLWRQSNLLFREQYEYRQDIDVEILALESIARGAAGVLVTSMFEGF